jgi:hypothetical protein
MIENKKLACPDCGCESFVQEDIGEIRCMGCGRTFGTGFTAEVLMRCEEAMKLSVFDAMGGSLGERFVLDDPDKLSEGDGSMIEELMRRIDEIPPRNVLMHRDICTSLNELYARKNRDYGDSFHKTYLEEGMAMARIRLTDKLERFKKLTREGGQAVKDESIRDTLIDLANYAIMTVMEMDREAEENGCG